MNSYTREEKIAILLVAFGHELAAEFLKKFSKNDVKRITQAMQHLSSLDQDEVDQVIDEFHGLLGSSLLLEGGEEKTEQMLRKALKTQDISKFIERSPRIRSLDRLDAVRIADLLLPELPQTIALILCHLEHKKSAEILTKLPSHLHSEILQRMAHLEAVSVEVIEDLDEELRLRAQKISPLGKKHVGGVKSVGQMLSSLDPESFKQMLSSLEERDPDLALKVSREMFTFEQLVTLGDHDLQKVLQQVSSDLLQVALRQCSQELREKIYKNMSQRNAKMLQEDLQNRPKIKLSDVLAAQEQILSVVMRLHKTNIINIKSTERYV